MHSISRIADLSGEAPVKGLKTRREVSPGDTWDLTPLFADDAAWEAEFNTLAARYGEIASFRGTLARSARDLLDLLEVEKSLDRSSERLGQYAGLRLSEDGSHAPALDREGRLQSLGAKISEACSWVSPEIQAIPDGQFDAYLADPLLSEWVLPLLRLRRLKPHTLSNGEERLLALSMPTLAGHHETFSQLTNVDMSFGKVADDRGQEIELTQSSFSSLLQRPDREDGRPLIPSTRNFPITATPWPAPFPAPSRPMSSSPAPGTTPQHWKPPSSSMMFLSPSMIALSEPCVRASPSSTAITHCASVSLTSPICMSMTPTLR